MSELNKILDRAQALSQISAETRKRQHDAVQICRLYLEDDLLRQMVGHISHIYAAGMISADDLREESKP